MLSPEELAELEASLLPALERHHLRLLAHSLRSLQAAAGRRSGPLPGRAELLAWALDQPELQADSGFCQAFLDQLQGAGIQLEHIVQDTSALKQAFKQAFNPSEPAPPGPLGLDLADLVAWAQRQADRRIEKIKASESFP
ncbi:MAG: hypothetical protein CK536_00970 [Synechococcus sp. Baikal-G1]|nr:MAG: hypothetical protein CK536_00970 [Synechococcus sp. Baikal-G1]